jgi:uncharacterized repeat protein (TIGR01451 family)
VRKTISDPVFDNYMEVVMSNKKIIESFPVRSIVALLFVVGLALLSAWILSTPGLKAGGLASTLTFTSPIGNPQFGLRKTVDNNAPMSGEQITYTLAYSNTRSGSQAFNVRLYDFLPAGAQLVSTNPAATSYSDGVLLFTAPSVGPGTEDHAVTVRVNVLPGYDQLYNHALIVADSVTPTLASLLTNVTQQPGGQLQLTKSGPLYSLVNGQLVYTLRCENLGDVTLSDVTLADILPSGLPLLGASPTPDVATLPLLRWSLGDLGPGQVRTVVITSTAPATAGTITNTAVAGALQAPMATATFSTQVVATGAILRVTKAASAPSVSVGGQLVYTLQYWNAGDQAATGVLLTDTLPSGITVTAAYPTPVTALSSPQLVWNLGTVSAAGPPQTIVVTATVGGTWNRTLHNVADVAGQSGSYPDHAEVDTEVRPFMLYLPVVMKQY